jgi:hypothetical protein
MRKTLITILLTLLGVGALALLFIKFRPDPFVISVSCDSKPPVGEKITIDEETDDAGPIAPDVQLASARHEAAHAVMNAILKPRDPVREIQVNAVMDEKGGYGWVLHATTHRAETKPEMLSDIVEDLAGRSADELLNGAADTGAAFDLESASATIHRMCGQSGLCGSLIYKEAVDEIILERCLNLMKIRSDRLVMANAGVINALAEAIMAKPEKAGKRLMGGDEFRTFLKEWDLADEAELGLGPASCP